MFFVVFSGEQGGRADNQHLWQPAESFSDEDVRHRSLAHSSGTQPSISALQIQLNAFAFFSWWRRQSHTFWSWLSSLSADSRRRWIIHFLLSIYQLFVLSGIKWEMTQMPMKLFLLF